MKSLMAAKTPPASAGHRRRDGERHGAYERGVEADRLARDLRVAHRAHGLAPGADLEPGVEPEGERGQQQDQHRDLALGELAAGEARRRDADEAVPAAGEPAELGCPLLDDEAEGDRHHGEVGPAHAQRRHGEQHAGHARNHARKRQRQPEADGRFGREDADHVGADGVEGHVAERDLPRQPQQHIEADADDGGQPDQGQDVELVVVGPPDEGAEDGHGDGNEEHPAQAHTLRTSARPNRPFGIRVSETMTRPKVTICV